MENKQVTYSYSSYENEEIRKIRQKYEPKQEKKSVLEKVKKLDKSVNDIASAISIATGIIGTLVFGAGLSMILLVPDEKFWGGVFLGIIGIITMIAAYPVNQFAIIKRRQKIAPIILELTDSLINKNS